MSGKLSSPRKRLDKLEQRMADRELRVEMAVCNCRHGTLAIPFKPEDFEAEMNLPCPAHGFRRLGRILRIAFRNPGGTAEPSPRLDELIAIYNTRLSRPTETFEMPTKNPDSRCTARAKTGKRCTAAATASGRCYFHTHPKKAFELGRIGGRNKRPPVTENVDPLPTLDNALAMRDTVTRLVADVREKTDLSHSGVPRR